MRVSIAVISVCLALAVASCGKKDAPSGQVVATVDGQEITNLELRSELGGFGTRDPAVMKAAQQQALEAIIMRKLVAEEARKEKLDKTVDYNLKVLRGEELLLVQSLQQKIGMQNMSVSRQDAERYIAERPQQFADRKVYFVDQVIVGPNKLPLQRYEALNSLEGVRALFIAEGVTYQDNVTLLDTLTLPPEVLQQIQNLPAGEVFVIPQGGGLLFNHITSTRSVPFKGEPAIVFATELLRNQKAQAAAKRRFDELRKAAEKKIVYNPDFKPQPVKAQPASAAPKA